MQRIPAATLLVRRGSSPHSKKAGFRGSLRQSSFGWVSSSGCHELHSCKMGGTYIDVLL